MSAAKMCDQCGTATADAEELDLHWFQVRQCGDTRDFCTAVCAVAGVEAMKAASDEAWAEAMTEPSS